MYKKALIIANGRIDDYDFYEDKLKKYDFFIGVDGGVNHGKAMGIEFDLIVGDFDSFDEKDKLKQSYPNAQIITFEAEKDYTDTELAINYVIEKQFDEVTIIGGLGNRMDHTLANLKLMEKLNIEGIRCIIIDEKNELISLNACETDIVGRKGENFSIVPIYGDLIGVTLVGFKYPLEDYLLPYTASTGISNIINEDLAKVLIRKGTAIGIFSRD